MVKQSQQTEDSAVELEIALRKVCFIILKGREFEAEDTLEREESPSDPRDDMEFDEAEGQAEDSIEEEIVSLIDAMTVDEQIDLVALHWLGREDGNTAADWPNLRRQAAEAHNKRTSRYLIGDPMLPDNLEAGLAVLGMSCADYED